MKTRQLTTLALLFTLLAISLPQFSEAANSTTYTSNTTYTVPTGVTLIKVEVIGGGGGGSGVQINANRGNPGGGGGGYSMGVFSVTPGTNITATIGLGGTSSASSAGTQGGTTSVNWSSNRINATGGQGGPFADSPGGQGGTGFGGTISYTGGRGGNVTASGSNTFSGGGGAAAGSTGNGASGNGVTGGTGTGISGSGGTGTAADGSGTAGSNYGGGGAGAFCDSSCAARAGSAGAQGAVRITEYAGTNIVLINIYGEITGASITGTNVSITASSDAYTTSTSTTTGAAIVEDLPDGDYTFSFNSGGAYAQRQYTVTASNGSLQTLNAYLLNSTSTTVLVVEGANGPDAGQPIEGATVTWETLINSTFTTIESRFTDISGTAGPFAYLSSSLYRITVTADGYTTKQFVLNPVQYSSYDVNLISQTTFTNAQDYEGISIVFTPSTYYNAAQNNFTFIISSPNGTLTAYNYTITYPTGTVTNSGVNSYGSTLTSAFNITGATVSSTVNLAYCYTTAVTGMRCFSRSYPVVGQFGNYTLASAAAASTGMGDLEKILLATIGTAVIVGTAGLAAGPVAGGAVWLLSMGFFYKILAFNIWLLLIPGFVGFIIIAWGMARQ